jgi:hypothetical protein
MQQAVGRSACKSLNNASQSPSFQHSKQFSLGVRLRLEVSHGMRYQFFLACYWQVLYLHTRGLKNHAGLAIGPLKSSHKKPKEAIQVILLVFFR